MSKEMIEDMARDMGELLGERQDEVSKHHLNMAAYLCGKGWCKQNNEAVTDAEVLLFAYVRGNIAPFGHHLGKRAEEIEDKALEVIEIGPREVNMEKIREELLAAKRRRKEGGAKNELFTKIEAKA